MKKIYCNKDHSKEEIEVETGFNKFDEQMADIHTHIHVILIAVPGSKDVSNSVDVGSGGGRKNKEPKFLIY